MPRKIVALVTEYQAKVGTIFTVRATRVCSGCKLFEVCMGKLRPGGRYKVIKVRNFKQKCPVLSEYLRVSVVEELPIRLLVNKRLAMEGITITYTQPKCPPELVKELGELCSPRYIANGEKVRIIKILQILPGDLAIVEAELLQPPPSSLWSWSSQRQGLRQKTRRRHPPS